MKIKGSIKNENWHKYLGFRVWIMIASVPFMSKIKGDCKDSSLLFSATLCLYISLTFSLTSFLSRSPHLPTFFVWKCLLNKLTALWHVISKAQWRGVLMLNLFCIHLRWRGLSALPSRSYSLPSSSGLRAHTWSLLFVVGSMLASLYSPFAPPSLLFFFPPSVCKSCDHFSGCGYKDLRRQWCSKA